MVHIITCGSCGKTWLVSSRICIYSFMRLRTYTRLGERLRRCWTICHSLVFNADICVCTCLCLYYIGILVVMCYGIVSQKITNTSVFVCLRICICVFVVEDSARVCIPPLWARICDKHVRICLSRATPCLLLHNWSELSNTYIFNQFILRGNQVHNV